MRPLAPLAFAAAVLAPAAIVQAAETWSVQSFPAERFSIEAPVKLERQPVQQIEGAGAMQSFVGVEGQVVYIVTATDISAAPEVGGATPDQIVDLVMAGSLEGSTLVSQRPATHPGGVARDFTMRTGEGDLMRNRIVYQHPWVYSNLVATKGSDPAVLDGASANRFLGSLKASR